VNEAGEKLPFALAITRCGSTVAFHALSEPQTGGGHEQGRVRRCLSSAPLANKSLILIVATNPEPHNISARLNCQGAVMNPYPDRPKFADFLKVQ
jgi:hypothetical protein